MILFADETPSPPARRTAPPESLPESLPESPPPKKAEVKVPSVQSPAKAIIKVIGIGGGGGNSVNRMIEAGVGGVEFIAANTDAQVLEKSLAPTRLQLGTNRTRGLGCGGDPEVGRLAATDDMDVLVDALQGADMIFITLGAGGGTGTGAGPVAACVAQEVKALCVAVVTRPFTVEGRRRQETAEEGIRELREYVDTLICVPNDRVVEVYGDKPIREAFRDADDVVRQAVQGISDLIQTPGEINLDFADVRAAMKARGDAVMGIGVSSGPERVADATQAAISSRLLEDTSIRGATSILINVTGGETLSLRETKGVVDIVREAVEHDGLTGGPEGAGDNILLGTAVDPQLDEGADGGRIKVTVVATGFPSRGRHGATPRKLTPRNLMAAQATPERIDPPAHQEEMPARQDLPLAKVPGGEASSDLPDLDDRWGDLSAPAFMRKQS